MCRRPLFPPPSISVSHKECEQPPPQWALNWYNSIMGPLFWLRVTSTMMSMPRFRVQMMFFFTIYFLHPNKSITSICGVSNTARWNFDAMLCANPISNSLEMEYLRCTTNPGEVYEKTTVCSCITRCSITVFSSHPAIDTVSNPLEWFPTQIRFAVCGQCCIPLGRVSLLHSDNGDSPAKRSILSYFITGFGVAKCRENRYIHYGLVDRIRDL